MLVPFPMFQLILRLLIGGKIHEKRATITGHEFEPLSLQIQGRDNAMPFADLFRVGRRRQEPSRRHPESQEPNADGANEEEAPEKEKELRSLRIKAGLRRKQSMTEEKLNSLEQDMQQRIARVAFGGWAAGSKGTAARYSEDFSYFEDEQGNLQGYSTTSRVDSQVFRAKSIGVLSHLQAQKNALLEWLGNQAKSHVILTRVCDDTNAAFLQPTTKCMQI